MYIADTDLDLIAVSFFLTSYNILAIRPSEGLLQYWRIKPPFE